MQIYFLEGCPASAVPFDRLSPGLLIADFWPRHLRSVQFDSVFQAIADRNAQLAFLAHFVKDECKIVISSPQLTHLIQILVGRVRSLLSRAV
jgi:hypothetical protein